MEAGEKKKLQQFRASARRRRAAVHCKGRQPWTMFDGAHSCCCCRNTKIQEYTAKEGESDPGQCSMEHTSASRAAAQENYKKEIQPWSHYRTVFCILLQEKSKKRKIQFLMEHTTSCPAAALLLQSAIFPFNLPFFLIAWIHLRRRKQITRIHGWGSSIVTFATFFEPWMLSGTFSYEWTTLCGTFS